MLQLGGPQPSQSWSDLSRVLPLEPNRLFWNMTDLRELIGWSDDQVWLQTGSQIQIGPHARRRRSTRQK